MLKMLCPRCEQDYLDKVTIIKLKKIAHICPECEAAWFSEKEIEKYSFVDLFTYLREHGVSTNKDELKFHDKLF